MAFRGDPEEAYKVWAQMTATEWRHLPIAGGLLDQPETLWEDLMTIEFMNRRVKESRETAHG